MTIKIKSIASSIPGSEWTNEKIHELTGADPEFVAKKVGVGNRYFLKEDESGVDLAYKAVTNLLEKSNTRADQIELLVFITQTPDYRIPQNSSLLHERLELSSMCASFDISLGCSGYVYGLSITQGLMEIQGMKNAILVTCDPYSKIMDKHDKNTMTIFGDAATATMLCDEGIFRIGKADMGTDGSYSSSLKINHGGAVRPFLGIHKASPELGIVEDVKLNMKGRDVFNFVVSNIPKSIERCLDSNDLKMKDISWFALHQGSKHMLDYMASRGNIPTEKMLRNLYKYGNTVSSTVPMLLEELLDENDLINDSKVLISGFGVGLSWATNILTYRVN